MPQLPHWQLSPEEIQEAKDCGFDHEDRDGKFYLQRASDQATIWPHIDGFISAFIRQGLYVKHKKYLDLTRAMTRKFGDTQ
jgi:hypothetical protein